MEGRKQTALLSRGMRRESSLREIPRPLRRIPILK